MDDLKHRINTWLKTGGIEQIKQAEIEAAKSIESYRIACRLDRSTLDEPMTI